MYDCIGIGRRKQVVRLALSLAYFWQTEFKTFHSNNVLMATLFTYIALPGNYSLFIRARGAHILCIHTRAVRFCKRDSVCGICSKIRSLPAASDVSVCMCKRLTFVVCKHQHTHSKTHTHTLTHRRLVFELLRTPSGGI